MAAHTPISSAYVYVQCFQAGYFIVSSVLVWRMSTSPLFLFFLLSVGKQSSYSPVSLYNLYYVPDYLASLSY